MSECKKCGTHTCCDYSYGCWQCAEDRAFDKGRASMQAEVAALKGTARAMFAAEEEYGCGFYNYPKWVAAYSTLAALVEK